MTSEFLAFAPGAAKLLRGGGGGGGELYLAMAPSI
jgi:hypothetical protein